MLSFVELCARNISAATREAMNAEMAARTCNEAMAGTGLAIPESVVKNLTEARYLLELAQQEMKGRA